MATWEEVRRGHSRQANPRPRYPQWGMEYTPRETNARRLYRYGERGLLTRCIIPPDEDSRVLYAGFTVGDAVMLALGVAWFVGMTLLFGQGIDNWLDWADAYYAQMAG